MSEEFLDIHVRPCPVLMDVDARLRVLAGMITLYMKTGKNTDYLRWMERRLLQQNIGKNMKCAGNPKILFNESEDWSP